MLAAAFVAGWIARAGGKEDHNRLHWPIDAASGGASEHESHERPSDSNRDASVESVPERFELLELEEEAVEGEPASDRYVITEAVDTEEADQREPLGLDAVVKTASDALRDAVAAYHATVASWRRNDGGEAELGSQGLLAAVARLREAVERATVRLAPHHHFSRQLTKQATDLQRLEVELSSPTGPALDRALDALEQALASIALAISPLRAERESSSGRSREGASGTASSYLAAAH